MLDGVRPEFLPDYRGARQYGALRGGESFNSGGQQRPNAGRDRDLPPVGRVIPYQGQHLLDKQGVALRSFEDAPPRRVLQSSPLRRSAYDGVSFGVGQRLEENRS